MSVLGYIYCKDKNPDMTALVAHREVFIKCGAQADYRMLPHEQPGERHLDLKRVDAYLAGLSAEARHFAELFLKHVRYVPFNELYVALHSSLDACYRQVATAPWAILLSPGKYGSEWWLTQMLLQHELKGREPLIISAANPTLDPSNIVIIDDCAYSGNNVLSIIDEFTDSVRTSITPGRYTFHLVIPYMSTEAYTTITKRIHAFGGSQVRFYYVQGLLPGIFDVHPRPDEAVLTELKLDPTTNFLPIYFDHKIAGSMSTAKAILNAVVHPPPSRASILRASACYIAQAATL